MSALNLAIKRAFSMVGLTIERRDRLAEQIDGTYLRSPYLPPIYRQSFGRLLYFREMFERSRDVPGDLVECGVSIGTGLLNWALFCELAKVDRTIYGFDSFEGFPASIEADRKKNGAFETGAGDYASPPELVLKVLEQGRVSPQFVQNKVRLVRGFFDATLPSYAGSIALLHLDCDLHDSYVTCLEQLYSRVTPGGIIMFDEYEDDAFPGARVAIDRFLADKPEKPIRYEAYGYIKYHIVKH